MLWDQTYYDGTPTTNRVYYQKSLTAMVQQPSDPTQPPSWWAVTSANGINDNGAIIGLASYTQIPYAPVQHGVLLLPCQFRLLNGDTNPNDVDGMDFSGNRPTTISATSNYNSEWSTEILANEDSNAIGSIYPFHGRTDDPGQAYTYSLELIAKVASASFANITYSWGRVYRQRNLIITPAITNNVPYWYVKSVNGGGIYATGYPQPLYDTGSSLYYINTPSTNNNIVVFSDNPALGIDRFVTLAGPDWANINISTTNVYFYQKRDFIYFLTNSIGSSNAIATQHVGVVSIVEKTNNSGIITNDYKAISNIASTTNIPDCSGATVSEIRAIVWPSTNSIILDSNVTNDIPNPVY